MSDQAKTPEPAPGEAHRQLIRTAELRRCALAARESFQAFIAFMMVDPEHADDPTATLYDPAPHHDFLAGLVERVHRRELRRAAISMPPQHGKTTHLTDYATAWKVGNKPYLHRIVGTYNQTFAEERGTMVREIMRSPRYKLAFPEVKLDSASQSKSIMKVRHGKRMAGSITFVGRGVATTGRPADDFTLDDPYKDKAECDSQVIRQQARDWFNAVVFSRCHALATITVVHTRWNEDDLIGWLCDPGHPEHDERRSSRWFYINLPAVVTDPKIASALKLELAVPTDEAVVRSFGDQPMAALWATCAGAPKFPLEHLAEANENDSSIFSALYMGRPSPEEGAFFKADHIVPYHSINELPKDLRYYAASDHAVSMEQYRDPTCMGVVGVDEVDDIWILPDLVWRQIEADTAVAEMLRLMERHRPTIWWAEKGHISKSIGPFLRKRMIEDNVYTYVEEVNPAKDKKTRAQSIRARMAQKKVHFPVFAPWWQNARNELLKFPNATHDDFVDFVAHIGMGLDKEIKAKPPVPTKKPQYAVGTISWVKWAHKQEQELMRRIKAHAGR